MPAFPAPHIHAVDGFVRRHFLPLGTLRLHRGALGWDLLRAPVNVALAPVFLLTRLVALVLRLLGLRRAGLWLGRRRILLPTAVARAVGARVEAELLRPLIDGAAPLPAPLRRQLLEDYTSVRSAVSEITTTLFVLVAGYLVFSAPTPGVLSLAPRISGHLLHRTAVEGFPLGQRLGSVWYGVFPVELPLWYVIGVGVTLAMAASLVTTFAGLMADPVQAVTGLHRRRLLRLLRRAEAAKAAPGGLAPEHILARAGDLTDIGLGLIRFFRP